MFRKKGSPASSGIKSYLLAALLVILFAQQSCSKTGGNLDKIESMADVQFEVVDGDSQSGMPKLPFKKEILFRVTDSNGGFLANSKVSVALINVTGKSKPSRADILLAIQNSYLTPWESRKELPRQKGELDQIRYTVLRDDFLGRLEGKVSSTDSRGIAKVTVLAPGRFDESVAVVLFLGTKAADAKNFGFATLKTKSFSQGARLQLVSSGRGSQFAGRAFDLTVRLVDEFGNLDRTFDQNMKFKLSNNAGTSWTGRPAALPNDFVCSFEGGLCLVPGGPFVLNKSEIVTLNLKDLSNIFPDFKMDLPVEQEKSPWSVVVADKAEGEKGGAKIIKEVKVSTEDQLNLFAFYIDAGGNSLGPVVDARWQVTDTNLQAFFPSLPSAVASFAPVVTGSGELSVLGSQARTLDPVRVSVPSGPQKGWKLTTERKDVIKASECTNILLEAVDGKGNTVTFLDGLVQINLKLENANPPPAVFDITHFRRGLQKLGDQSDVTANFSAGKTVLSERLCAFKETDTPAKVVVSGSGFESRVPFSVERGPPSTIVLSSATPNSPIVNLCTDQTQATNLASPCVTFSADLDNQLISPILTDSAGNRIRGVDTTWTVTGPLSNTIANNAASSSVNFTPQTTGKGFFQLNTSDNFQTEYAYEVLPGAPLTLQVKTQNLDNEIATNPFKVGLEWFDKRSNVVTTYNFSKPIVLDLVGASSSPSGQTPISNQSETLSFSSGKAISTKMLHAVKAEESPRVRVTIEGRTFFSNPLTVSPGIRSQIMLRDSPGNQGVALVSGTTKLIQVNEVLSMFIAGYDSLENFIGDASASFTGSTQDVVDSLSSTSGRTSNFTPIKTMEGTVTVVTLDSPVLSLVSPTLRVTAKTAGRYEVSTTNNLSETAGNAFDVIIKAVDVQNNIDLDYQGPVPLRLTSQAANSWLGNIPILPNGDITCVFANGQCTLPKSGLAIAAGGWISHDAEGITVVSVQDVSTVPKILKPATAIVSVAKKIPTSLVLSDKIGGKALGAIPLDNLVEYLGTAGVNVPFTSSTVDSSGNWIEDATSTWSGNVTEIDSRLAPRIGPSILFSPQKVVSAGILSISTQVAGGTTLTTQLNIKISHGVASTVSIFEENNLTSLSAGKCHRIHVQATDAFGNRVLRYSSQLDMKIALRNYNRAITSKDLLTFPTGIYLDSGGATRLAIIENDPVYSTTPYIQPLNNWNIGGVLKGVTFANGTLAEKLLLCVADAGSGVNPKINIELPSISVASPTTTYPVLSGENASFSVPLGNEAWVGFKEKDGSTPSCQVKLRSYFDPSIQLTFEQATGGNFGTTNPTYICSDQREWGLGTPAKASLEYRAYVYDKGGNYLRDASGTFTMSSRPSSESILVQTDKVLSFQARKAIYEKNNVFNLTALYSFHLKDAPTQLLSPRMDVFLSPLAAATMTVDAPPFPRAGSNFGLTFSFFDTFENPTGSALPSSISVSHGGTAINSPGGFAPVIPTSLLVAGNGNNGVSFLTGLDFMLASTANTVNLNFTPVPSNVAPVSASMQPIPGVPTTGYLAYKDSDSTPVVFPVSYITTETKDFVYVTKDAPGNTIGKATLDPSMLITTGVLNGKFDFRELNSVIRLKPIVSGVGTFTLNPPNGLAQVNSGNVTISDAPISTFDIEIIGGTGTEGEIVTAGIDYTVKLTARDAVGNLLTGFTGSKVMLGSVAPQNANPENKRNTVVLPIGNSVDFVNGVSNPAQIIFKPLNSSEVPSLIFGFNGGAGVSATATKFVDIRSNVFHHYGVATNTPIYEPKWDRSTTFSVTASIRDASGNILSSGGPNLNATLELQKQVGPTGVKTFGDLGGTVNLGIISNPVTVSNLTYTEVGNFRVVVKNNVTPIVWSANQNIEMQPNIGIVKNFSLNFFSAYAPNPLIPGTLISPAYAGVEASVKVTAIDAYDRPAPGIDSILEALTFTTSGFGVAPNAEAPTYSSNLTFSVGSAFLGAIPVKAETLAINQLQVVISNGYNVTLKNQMEIIVSPGALENYLIETPFTTRTADSNPTTGRFSVRIQAFDKFNNPRAGEPSAYLNMIRISGAANSAPIVQPGNYTSQQVQQLPINLSSGDVTLNDLAYFCAQTAKIAVTGSAVLVQTQPTIVFSPTLETIRRYVLDLPTSAQVGPSNFPVTVYAKDHGGNNVTGIDSLLNNSGSINFTWTTFANSGNGTPPTLPRPTFSNGVGTGTLSLFGSQTLIQNSLKFQDTFGADGVYSQQITISPKPANDMVITPEPLPSAITTFSLTTAFLDVYGNVTSTGLPAAFNFNLNGSAPTSPKGTVAEAPASLSVSINTGNQMYSTGSVFRLPNSGFTSYLTVTPTTGTLAPKVLTIRPTVGPVDLNLLSNDAAGSNTITGPLIYNTIDRPTIYYVQKDAERNVIGVVPVAVSGSGSLVGKVATDASLTAVLITPTLTGSGSFTVTPINPLTPPITIASVSVVPSPVSTFDITVVGATGAGLNQVNAGTTYQIKLTAYDVHTNKVTDFTGVKTISSSIAPATPNAENKTSLLSMIDGTTVTFTNGETDPADITFKPFNSAETPALQFLFTGVTPNASGSKSITVQAGSFHHYGAASTSTYIPSWNRALSFSSVISLRDLSGNILTSGGPGLPVTLSIKKDTGAAARGSLSGTVNLSAITNPVTVTDLAYDDAGSFSIFASDGTIDTPLSATSLITMTPSLELVKEFKLSLSGGTSVAGNIHNSTLRALDNYNTPVSNIDSQLGNLQYAFTGIANAPDGTNPDLPNSLAFSSGSAPVSIKFYKAETLAIGQIAVDITRLGSAFSSTSSDIALVVSPAALNTYKLTSASSTATADGNASTGRFNISIQAYDNKLNPRAGEPNLTLSPNLISGVTSVTTVTDSGMSTAGTTNLDLSSGSLTLSNLTYLVPHLISFKMTGTSVNSTSSGAQIQFTPTLATVKSYALSLPVSVGVGLANLPVTILAKDIANNTVTGIDATLNNPALVTFAWSGAPTSPSPSSQAPGYGTGTWASGSLSVTHSVYGAAVLGGGALQITDSLGRFGSNGLPLSINAGTVTSLTPNTLSFQTAGVPFTITVVARDTYSNPTGTGCSAMNVTGGNTSLGGFGGAATNPALPSGTTQGITGYFTTGNITLYAANYDLTQASVANPNRLNLAACSMSVNVDVDVRETIANQMVISTASTVPASLAANLTEALCYNPAGTSASVACATMYSFFWDIYGNRVDPANYGCSWTYIDNGAVAAGATGLPNVTGGGFSYTVTHTDFIDGKLRCTKGAKVGDVNVYGGVSRVTFADTYPGSAILANNNNVTVSSVALYSRKNNVEIVAPGLQNPETITFTSQSVVAMASLAGLNASATSVTCTFASSICPTSYSFNFNQTEANKTVTLAVRGKSKASTPITVIPNDAVTTLTFIANQTTTVAGVGFTHTVEARDPFGNPTDRNRTGGACSTATMSLSDNANSPGTTGGGLGTATARTFTSALSKIGVGRYQTATITLFNQIAANTISYSACAASSPTVTQAVAVTAAAATAVQIKKTDTLATAAYVSHGATQTEICNNSGATTGDTVTCNPYFAYVYDTYGNQVGAANNVTAGGSAAASTCTWSYLNLGTTTLAASPTSPGTAHSWTPTVNGFIDGEVRCTSNSLVATARVYGGIHSITSTNNYNGTSVVAGNSNLQFNSIKINYSRNNVVTQRTESINEDVTISTNSITPVGTAATTQIGKATTTSGVTFPSGSSSAFTFNFVKVETAKQINITVRGKSAAAISSINVTPALANQISYSTTTAPTAGSPFAVTATVWDAFQNTVDTSSGCGNLTLSTVSGTSSPGGYGGVGSTAPVYPGSVTAASTGVYGPFNVTLYNVSASNSIKFTVAGASCLPSGVNQNFTVTSPAALNTVYLHSTNTVPASGSNMTTTTCTQSTTVTCPAINAFGWDTYGNNINGTSFVCGAWTYVATNGVTTPTGLGSSVHAVNLSSSTNHINGTLTCTTGGISSNIALSGVINKSMGWACNNWACTAGTPTSSCTITNSTLYDSNAASISGANGGLTVGLTTNSCQLGTTNGNTCIVPLSGTTGSNSGTLTLASTPVNATQVSFTNVNASVQSLAAAPNCATSLTFPAANASQWTCETGATGKSIFAANATNPNTLNSATLAASNAISIDGTVNGEVVTNSGCSNSSTVAAAGTCSATFKQSNPGVASTLRINPSTAYFSQSTMTTTASPNCAAAITLPATSSTCGVGGGTRPKTVAFTLINPNNLQPMNISSIAANNTSGTLAATSITGCGNGGAYTLAAGTTCNITVLYNNTPTGAINARLTVNTGTTTYFATGQIFNSGANYDISCP